jgi:glucokinase
MTKSSLLLLALDFGGTKHTAGVISPGQHQWHAHQRAFSPPNADATTDIKIMTALAREVLAGEKPTAIGVSFGGPVDFTTGTVRLSDHVPGWENIELRSLLQAEFSAPTSVDNDANVAAVG